MIKNKTDTNNIEGNITNTLPRKVQKIKTIGIENKYLNRKLFVSNGPSI